MASDGRPQRFSRVVSAATAPYLNLDSGAADCDGPVPIEPNPAPTRSHQTFGLWQPYNGTGSGFLTQATPALTQEMSMVSAGPRLDPVWWTIDLWAIEVARFVAVAGTFPPLTRGEINSRGGRFSRLKARVHYERVLSHEADVDIGTGGRFSVLAESVRVSLLTPGTFRLSGDKDAATNAELGPGTVLDTIVAASCYVSESPVGEKSATFTQFVTKGAGSGASQDIPVPPAARYVTIYQGPADPLNVPLDWMQIGATGTALLPVGTIDFPALSRRVDKIAVPQNVDTLRIPLGTAPADRGWNIIWHLEL